MPEYEFCLRVTSDCWITVEADDEANARAEALLVWDTNDCQNHEVTDVLVQKGERDGVLMWTSDDLPL